MSSVPLNERRMETLERKLTNPPLSRNSSPRELSKAAGEVRERSHTGSTKRRPTTLTLFSRRRTSVPAPPSPLPHLTSRAAPPELYLADACKRAAPRTPWRPRLASHAADHGATTPKTPTPAGHPRWSSGHHHGTPAVRHPPPLALLQPSTSDTSNPNHRAGRSRSERSRKQAWWAATAGWTGSRRGGGGTARLLRRRLRPSTRLAPRQAPRSGALSPTTTSRTRCTPSRRRPLTSPLPTTANLRATIRHARAFQTTADAAGVILTTVRHNGPSHPIVPPTARRSQRSAGRTAPPTILRHCRA